MLFNSYIFIFIFLPAALLGYFTLNHFRFYRAGKLFLVGMSFWFYAYFRLSYLWILLCSIALNYIFHLLLLRRQHTRLIAFCGILTNVAVLFYFKYTDFLLENINLLLHTRISPTGILLPLGISFFTFQQIAFLADTAKGSLGRQSLTDYALFVSFFPQLIAGPIVSHEEMLPQFQDLSKKRFSCENFYHGLRIFILGLSKKVLLADTFGQAVYWGFQNYASLDGFNTFLTALFYTLQLYLDFSGYCDMARGIGKLFNIEIPVNFLSPYKSANITEFWSRWHMTLTRFFTRYLYIPLGGNRTGLPRPCVHILLVFCVSGLWHGAGWTFLLWGILHGVLSVLTRLWHMLKERLKTSSGKKGAENSPVRFLTRACGVLLTFFFLICSWVLFRADTVSQAVYMLHGILTMRGFHLNAKLASFFQLPEFWYIIKILHIDTLPYAAYYCMAGILGFSLILVFGFRNLYETEKNTRAGFFRTAYMIILAVWCTLSLSGVSTFLYFNF